MSRENRPARPVFVSGSQLRSIIERALSTDAELDAFCLDYAPDIHRQFSAGMERTRKLNLLGLRGSIGEVARKNSVDSRAQFSWHRGLRPQPRFPSRTCEAGAQVGAVVVPICPCPAPAAISRWSTARLIGGDLPCSDPAP